MAYFNSNIFLFHSQCRRDALKNNFAIYLSTDFLCAKTNMKNIYNCVTAKCENSLLQRTFQIQLKAKEIFKQRKNTNRRINVSEKFVSLTPNHSKHTSNKQRKKYTKTNKMKRKIRKIDRLGIGIMYTDVCKCFWGILACLKNLLDVSIFICWFTSFAFKHRYCFVLCSNFLFQHFVFSFFLFFLTM